jgi:hypothetical protein
MMAACLPSTPGNSSQYGYNGNDNAGGQNITAFAVTSTQDYNYLNALSLAERTDNGLSRWF